MFSYLYVSHGNAGHGNTRTDFDAVGSIALMWRSALLKGLQKGEDFEVSMIDYYSRGIEQLLNFHDATILLADVPPEALARSDEPDKITALSAALLKLKAQNVLLNFIDHHAHDYSTGKRFLQYVEDGLLESAYISFMDAETDRIKPLIEKRSAAEMVLNFLENRYEQAADDIMRTIAAYSHDQDFGIRKIHEANRISAVIGSDFPPLELAGMLAHGTLWNEKLENVYQYQQARQRQAILKLKYVWKKWRQRDGREVPVVYALMPQGDALKVSPAGMHCIKAMGAGVAVLVQRYAFISLRIPPEENQFHAGEICRALGGGGHQGAASAGGRNGYFPYKQANESNFFDVVNSLDPILSRAAGVYSV